MNFKTKIWRCKRGLDTITAVFMLLIMFTALTVLAVAFATTSQSVQNQNTLEQTRAQEKIMLTAVGVNNAANVQNVTIENIGTIEVKIRALYEKQNGVTTFVTDPSTSPINANTNIPPGETLTIQTSSLNLPYDQSTRIIAVTERGTTSIDDLPTVQEVINTTFSVRDTSLLYIGPLVLNFTSFQYHPTDSSGNLLPGNWLPGWSVPKSSSVAWRITVMNNDTQGRDINLTKYACFTIANVEGTPQTTPTWYLNSTNKANPSLLLPMNQNITITFLWDAAAGNTAQTVYSQASTCMVFLTFYGFYNYPNGTTTPYGQTIPFEAVGVT